MNISPKKIIVLLILLGIGFFSIFKYAYMEGSISTVETLNEIGHLQLVRVEATIDILEAIQDKTIIPTANGASARVVDRIFSELVVIRKSLSKKQLEIICAKVNDKDINLLLKSDSLYGDTGNRWDQNGVKGIVEICGNKR